jgi:hypothetical protein
VSRAPVFAAALAFTVLGCGGSSGSPGDGGGAGASGGPTTIAGPHGCTNILGSCTSNGGLSCEEWAGYDAATIAAFKNGCNHPNQVWSTGPCDLTNSVGGCEVATHGICDVIWSFPPTPASAVQMGCTGQSQMFVTPP